MKVFSLTYNELVKQFKKTSIRVIIPIILLSAIILPFAVSKFENTSTQKSYEQSNEYLLRDIESRIESAKSDKTVGAHVRLSILEAQKEALKLKLDYKIGGPEDWRSKESENYGSVLLELTAIQAVLKGVDESVLLENLYNVNEDRVSKYYQMTFQKKKEIENRLIAEKEEIFNIIATKDFKKHTEKEMELTQRYLDDFNNDIVEYEKLVIKNPKDEDGKSKLEEAKLLMEYAIVRINELEQDLAILKFRYDNNINYEKNNWKNKSIISIEDEIREIRKPMFTEKEFSVQAPQFEIDMKYNEYVENFKATNKVRTDKIKELWYGLENNIPDLNAVNDARSAIDSTYDIYVILAVIVSIIIGGGIVSQEFSTGSIRLLLIRPVSRWKILLSKLLTVVVIGLGVTIAGILILIVSSGVVFGFETLQVPVLKTVSGSIVEVNYIKYMLPELGVSIASLLFIVSLVFTISTVAKNTSLAVAISMLLYLGALPITMVLGTSLKQGWILNTFIPYMNNSAMKFMPIVLETMKEQLGVVINQTAGLTQLCIISILMLVITFAIFIKKDVKN